MSKIVLFSDLHAHPYAFGASIDEVTGRNSRLQDCLNVLDWTSGIAYGSGAGARLFIGDMFHIRGRLAPSVINPISDHFARVHPSGEEQDFIDFLIPGNHDQEHRVEGEHALYPLRADGVWVRDGHGYQPVNDGGKLRGLGIGWVSYVSNITELKAQVKQVAAWARLQEGVKRRILIIHHGVDGTMPNIPDCGFGAADLPIDTFDWVFCGDYHNHKEIIPGKAWMVGAPLQHTFGDVGQSRGCVLLDTDDGRVSFIENTEAPRFVTVDLIEGKMQVTGAKDVKGNFVRVRADDQKALEKIAAKITDMGARAVQTELVRDWKQITRADVTLSMTTSQMFRTWLKDQELGGIDPDELAKLNDEILAEAGVA
jgi:DNA repair exonuclease SbcCD nuclease subunit